MADNQLTVAKLEGGSLDLDTLATFVSGDENTVNHPRLRPDADVGSIAELRKKVTDDAKAQVDQQLKVLPSGHKGYATLAAAQAAQSTLAANTLVEVTNDTTTANNGVYLWNGTTLTKSAYGSIADAKTYTDTSLKPYVKTYNTLAEMNAVTGITTGQVAKVTNDATATNIGDYRYSGTAWVKFSDGTVLANAKAYTDGLPLLTNQIIASNDKSEKLIGIISSIFYTSPSNILTIQTTGNTKFSYLFAVKPNTTYTMCVKASGTGYIREFVKKPETYQGTIAADAGQDLVLTQVTTYQRYATFTTGATTNWIVFDPKFYTNYDWVLCEGSYVSTMWDSFSELTYNKTINADTLNVKQINSDTIVKSKNLFDGYNLGGFLYASVVIGAESTPITYSSMASANNKKHIGAYIPVQPNTTYTISKEPSNKFQVVLLKADRSTGTLIMRDVSLRQYTFTTNADTAFVFIYLSDNYEQPRVQVELGDKVTAYESRGMRFVEQAKPLGKLLTDDVKQTDNTYISLGVQTDRFSYGSSNGNSVTYADVIDNLYEPLRTLYPQNIRRNVLGKDSSGTYDIYEYIFEPDNYEQKIVITAGVHPTEIVTPFALGILLNEIYRNPSKHEGLAYLRNKVKLVIIPVVNVWGMNQNPKKAPDHYLNPNAVNPIRNFPERWDVLDIQGIYDAKGNAPLDQAESLYMYNVLKREKDNLAFSFDLHTGQDWTQDTILYWQEDDNFLRPVLQNIVSMRNDIVRTTLGREPINETYETQRSTRTYHAWRVFGVPSATIEYGLGMETANNLKSSQTTAYVDIVFNCVWYALKANIRSQLRQAELNEQNKTYISLFGRLTAYNDVVNFKWTYAQIQSELYDKLGLTKTTIAASGSYQLVQYTSAPDGYKNTVVLVAGRRGNERKSVTELMYFAYKLFTDSNPHIVALRNSTRFIILPCLNPYGLDNNSLNNANNEQPYLNFATSTQPESVSLRSFIDAGGFDLFVEIDAYANAYKPSGYADCQIIYNPKADTDYQATFAVLMRKYGLSAVSNSAVPYSTSLTKSPIADYINSKGIAYSYNFFAQNVLPKRVTVEGKYVDYGYEADELMYCSEVLFNNIKELCKRLSLRKYLAV